MVNIVLKTCLFIATIIYNDINFILLKFIKIDFVGDFNIYIININY